MLKAVRSIWDYWYFFEFTLSDHKKTYIATLLGTLLIAVVTFVYSETQTQWSGYAWLAPTIWVAGWVIKVLTAIRPKKIRTSYEFRPAGDLNLRIRKNSYSNEFDEINGWETVPPGCLVQGGVQISRKFNSHCMLNPSWDANINIVEGYYENILRNIRRNREAFKQKALRTTLKKLFDGQPLINEPKIAIASDFHCGMEELDVFESRYLATWCTTDLANLDIVAHKAGDVRSITSYAKDRVAFEGVDTDRLILRKLSVVAKACSTQIGINFIGITADNILLVAIQGAKTMHGANARVPLASGSMDWKDCLESQSLKELGEIAANRELVEEWGKNKQLAKSKPLKIERFVPAGIFRVLNRSGKPEFAAIGRLNWDEHDLRADKTEVDEWERQNIQGRASFRYSVPTFEAFCGAIESLINDHDGIEDTAPLFGVLKCVQGLIEDAPEALKVQLGYDTNELTSTPPSP